MDNSLELSIGSSLLKDIIIGFMFVWNVQYENRQEALEKKKQACWYFQTLWTRKLLRKMKKDFAQTSTSLNKIAFGVKHFAALNRKFDISYLDRSDLIPLTGEAKELIKGK